MLAHSKLRLNAKHYRCPIDALSIKRLSKNMCPQQLTHEPDRVQVLEVLSLWRQQNKKLISGNSAEKTYDFVVTRVYKQILICEYSQVS